MFDPRPLPGPTLVRTRRHGDERGFLSEAWSGLAFHEAGLDIDRCQDNHPMSREAGTSRGLHDQAPPAAQAKPVRRTRGRIRDVAVDLSRGRPTEGRWYGVELSAANWRPLLVPRNFLHGFLTLAPASEIIYKVHQPCNASAEGAVAWDDPGPAIERPLEGEPRISAKDQAAPAVSEWPSPFPWGGLCASW